MTAALAPRRCTFIYFFVHKIWYLRGLGPNIYWTGVGFEKCQSVCMEESGCVPLRFGTERSRFCVGSVPFFDMMPV